MGPLIVLSLFCSVFTGSCVTQFRSEKRSNAQTEILKSALGASRVETCTLLPGRLEISVPVRSARILKNEGRHVLLYEGVFRSGIKTIWQPLTPKFELNGDGVVLGQKGQSSVLDFEFHADAPGNVWTTYRYKAGESELYYAALEFLDKSPKKERLLRFRVPTGATDSVQQVWFLPGPAHGQGQIVVRTNSTSESSEERLESTYVWYAVNAKRNIVRKMAEFVDRSEGFSGVEFLPMAKTFEPLALAVLNKPLDEDAADPKRQRQINKIILKRFFAAGAKTEATLFQSPAALSSFNLKLPGSLKDGTNTLLAWVSEPVGTAYPALQWVAAKLDTSERGLLTLAKGVQPSGGGISLPTAAQPSTGGSLASSVKTLALNHQPVQVRFRPVVVSKAVGAIAPSTSGQTSGTSGNTADQAPEGERAFALSWAATVEDDFGYMATQVYPSAKVEERNVTRDAQGQLIKKLIPPTVGVYSSDPQGQIVGLYEPENGLEPSVLLIASSKGANGRQAETMGNSMASGKGAMAPVHFISLCTFDLKL